MKKRLFVWLVAACIGSCGYAESVWPYKNPNLPVEERVNDLLSRMTLEEKVGQLLCPLGWGMYRIEGREVVPSEKFKKMVEERNIGMLWGVYRADPWTKKTLENGLNPELAAKAGNALQRYVMEHTRLGIPVFLAEEAPHGHMAIGTTVFPTGLGMSSTWSVELMHEVGAAVGKEIRLQGGHISYGPVLDLAREPRWSRVEETFGEDPVLSGDMGAAMVKGLGGGDLSKPYSTLATLKHFIAYGIPEGGQNGNPSFVGMRELHENFLPPFHKVIEAGALSVMTSYNSLDGIPSTANPYLLTEVLRDDWKFRGIVVSDLYSIEGIHGSHRVAPTVDDAATMALSAGVDVDLGGDAFATLCWSVKEGKIDVTVVDRAVKRVLRLKFEMGLFEHPYVRPSVAKKEVRSEEHVRLARRVAQASVTLLKNERHTLPLSRQVRVALVGPNADNRYNLLGDYTAPQEDGNVRTVLDGICAKIPASQVECVKGCAIRDTLSADIPAAVEAARRADVVVAVVGGSSARDFKTSYKETGAAVAGEGSVGDMECGEGFDRATLSLLGKQQELLDALKATGKPLVVVYVEGRPLDKNWSAMHADALLTAYYPGQEGGDAIADVLFGDYNPAGRLSVSVPRSVGQLPVYYNKKNPVGHNYVEEPVTPLYSFGYGLSYTRFAYDALQVQQEGDSYHVSFRVTNTGDRDGEEVPQLYVRDEYASVVQPVQQLKYFTRFFLRKGESRQVVFTLTPDDLSIVDAEMKRRVEPGEFTLRIGASSDDIRLEGKISVK